MAIAARVLVQVVLMVVFRGEEVAHHLDLDFIARFQMGGEVGLDLDGVQQVHVVDAAAVLMADVMSLLVDGTDVLQLS